MRDQAEEAVERAGSRFGTVNAIARRARQLINGCPPLVGRVNIEKPAMTALSEIAAGKVACTIRQHRTRYGST